MKIKAISLLQYKTFKDNIKVRVYFRAGIGFGLLYGISKSRSYSVKENEFKLRRSRFLIWFCNCNITTL